MITAERKQGVRKKLANLEELALELLTREAKGYAQSKKNAPESFFKKLKICGDQLRVDFRLQQDSPATEDPSPAEAPQDPFHGLRIVDTGEDAA